MSILNTEALHAMRENTATPVWQPLLVVLTLTHSAPAIVTSRLVGDPIVFPGQSVYGIDMGGVAVLGSDVPDSTQLDDLIFSCTGALVSDRHILSAAHCFDEDEDGSVDFLVEAFPFAAGFQLVDRTEIVRIDTATIQFAPGWPDRRGDLAVLTLEAPAPVDIPRYPLYGKPDEVGQQVVIAGYGATGYGGLGIGEDEGPLFVNTLRAGLNRYEALRDDLDDLLLAYDFDSGFDEHNALQMVGFDSDLGFGEEEVLTAPGDSGGPVFIDGAIAGVTSFGGRLPPADVNGLIDNSWGELAFDVRVSAFRGFLLEATGGAAVFVVDKLPGDYNASGLVEQADLDLVLLNWGADATMPPSGWLHNLPAGTIDQAELDAVLLNWGATSAVNGPGSTAVPEPSGRMLGLICVLGLFSLLLPGRTVLLSPLASGRAVRHAIAGCGRLR